MEWNIHGVEYTLSEIYGVKYIKWDTYRVGHTHTEYDIEVRIGTYREWDTYKKWDTHTK